jgi:hypothetical protein
MQQTTLKTQGMDELIHVFAKAVNHVRFPLVLSDISIKPSILDARRLLSSTGLSITSISINTENFSYPQFKSTWIELRGGLTLRL